MIQNIALQTAHHAIVSPNLGILRFCGTGSLVKSISVSIVPAMVVPLLDMARSPFRTVVGWGRNKICSKSCAKVERIVNPRLEPA